MRRLVAGIYDCREQEHRGSTKERAGKHEERL
jgi:hypothetical protein